MDTPTQRSRWWRLVWAIPAALVLAAVVVLAARVIRDLPAVQDFMTTYPGRTELPEDAPVGFPAWLSVQHFLNSFFLLFVFRTAWELRKHRRPDAFWTRDNTGLVKTTNPPVRIGLPLWFHLTIDAFWVLNGIVYWVLLFATGQWVRVVPLGWDTIPNAISVGIQYASLYWPTENGWVNYNSLQLVTYFITVFVAAPLALLTGLRLSPGFASRLRPLDKLIPLRATRWVHVAVFVWFIGFTIAHVTLVLATGALRNLNHIYGLRDDESWVGFGIFAASIVVMIVAWVAAKPTLLASIAAKSGTVRKL